MDGNILRVGVAYSVVPVLASSCNSPRRAEMVPPEISGKVAHFSGRPTVSLPPSGKIRCAQRREGAKVAKKTNNAEFARHVGGKTSSSHLFCVLGSFASLRMLWRDRMPLADNKVSLSASFKRYPFPVFSTIDSTGRRRLLCNESAVTLRHALAVAARRWESVCLLPLKTLPRRANVSISTVSRVINRRELVNVKTRERVEEAIRELRYRPERVCPRPDAAQERHRRAGAARSARRVLFRDHSRRQSAGPRNGAQLAALVGLAGRRCAALAGGARAAGALGRPGGDGLRHDGLRHRAGAGGAAACRSSCSTARSTAWSTTPWSSTSGRGRWR